jgi:hypothetical protein
MEYDPPQVSAEVPNGRNCRCQHASPVAWDCAEAEKRATACIGEGNELALTLHAQDDEGAALSFRAQLDGVPQPADTLSGTSWRVLWRPPYEFTRGMPCREAELICRVSEGGPSGALRDSARVLLRVSRADPNLTCALSISPDAASTLMNTTIVLRSCVHNEGPVAARGVTWVVDEAAPSPRRLQRSGPRDLAVNETACDSVEVTLEQRGSFCFSGLVDPDNHVPESDESDNSCSPDGVCIESTQGDICVCPVPITPNDDGHNDRLRVDYSLRYPRTHPRLTVYDLHRNLVFDSDERKVAWIEPGSECRQCPRSCANRQECEVLFDGADSDGRNLPAGVYLYLFELNDAVQARGEVVIAR